jgi:hypothetical protein
MIRPYKPILSYPRVHVFLPPGPTQRTSPGATRRSREERKPQTLLMRGIAVALVLALTGSVAFTVPSHAQVAARRAAVLLPRALPTASIAGPEEEEPRDIIEVRCSHGLVPWLAGIPA